jgi:translation initiation factor 1A
MPKNKGKGGKNRKRGKNENLEDFSRELTVKNVNDGQDYAKVLRVLGGCNIEALCLSDGETRVCHISGKLRKKVWINISDIVLISIRSFQDSKGDVLLKYTPEEARKLENKNEIPHNSYVDDTSDNNADNVYFGNEENKDIFKQYLKTSDSVSEEKNIVNSFF